MKYKFKFLLIALCLFVFPISILVGCDKETTKSYVVKYYAEDASTILYQASVKENDGVEYDGETPTKAATQEYTYVFTSWVDEDGNYVDLTKITSDTNVYPKFTATAKQFAVSFSNENLIVTAGGANVTSGDLLTYGTSVVVTINNTDKCLLVNGEAVNLDSNNQYSFNITNATNLSIEQRLYELPMGKYDIVGAYLPDDFDYCFDMTYSYSAVYFWNDGHFIFWDGLQPTIEKLGVTFLFSDEYELTYERTGNEIVGSIYYTTPDEPVLVDSMAAQIVGDGLIVYDNILFMYNEHPLFNITNWDFSYNYELKEFFDQFKTDDSAGFLANKLVITYVDENNNAQSYFVDADAFNAIKATYDTNGAGYPVDEYDNVLSDYDILAAEMANNESTLDVLTIHAAGGWSNMLAVFVQNIKTDDFYIFWGKVSMGSTGETRQEETMTYVKYMISYNYNYMTFNSFDEDSVRVYYNGILSGWEFWMD